MRGGLSPDPSVPSGRRGQREAAPLPAEREVTSRRTATWRRAWATWWRPVVLYGKGGNLGRTSRRIPTNPPTKGLSTLPPMDRRISPEDPNIPPQKITMYLPKDPNIPPEESQYPPRGPQSHCGWRVAWADPCSCSQPEDPVPSMAISGSSSPAKYRIGIGSSSAVAAPPQAPGPSSRLKPPLPTPKPTPGEQPRGWPTERPEPILAGNNAMMEPGENTALDEWDTQIRKLPEEFESDTELEECDTENGELAAEIEHLTATLEERDRRISKLTSDLGESNAKLKERDRKITKLAAEIRRLTALLAERDSGLRKLRAELAKCDATIRIFTVELGERHTRIGELTADVEVFNKKLRGRTGGPGHPDPGK
ncbi:histone-lysine N-methyltransferase SETD1B-A-like isoform X3 [Corvus cornix cornix]|uniref:histone-lysine N-methyltransferase SETD1B-A-like isoform X3 n=1 Tax=Corvus cornix cornix TaxID=932674 RepID=UPI00195152DC|nr:histone-lysine N-methyltransferase SETD1B-A-like isoform X3 [Corvus cornix cornix]